VQVSDEGVECLGINTSQSFRDPGGGHHVKSLAFKCHIHHGANGIIVIHQEDSMRSRCSGQSYRTTSSLIVTLLLTFILEMCKSEQLLMPLTITVSLVEPRNAVMG
jgi:hypothetical protein